MVSAHAARAWRRALDSGWAPASGSNGGTTIAVGISTSTAGGPASTQTALWHGRFHRVGTAQLFGEVSFLGNGAGRCVDMGNGRFPRHRSARVYKIRFVNSSASYRGGLRRVVAPDYYGLKRTSPRSFKYGGPGPC